MLGVAFFSTQYLNLQLDIRKVKDEIQMKNQQIASLEKQMADSMSSSQNNVEQMSLSPVRPCSSWNLPDFAASCFQHYWFVKSFFFSQSYDELLEQLNEKSFELEVINNFQKLVFFYDIFA